LSSEDEDGEEGETRQSPIAKKQEYVHTEASPSRILDFSFDDTINKTLPDLSPEKEDLFIKAMAVRAG